MKKFFIFFIFSTITVVACKPTVIQMHTDAVIDGIPCMHILNLDELGIVANFFGITPENERDYLRRIPPKIYLRLDLPEPQLVEVLKKLNR